MVTAGIALAISSAAVVTFSVPALAAEPQALILSDSVSPGVAPDGSGDSLEQYEAQLNGFKVTLADGATWDSMTAAQFAQYQVLIIGDPEGDSSGDSFAAALENKSTWEPVVMSSGGNKVLIGTDPVNHYSPPAVPSDVLIGHGIAYAGAVSGATGAYIDLTQAYDTASPKTPVPLLDGLSTHGTGQFTVAGEGFYDACSTNVNIVAQTGPTAGLTDADLSDWGCSVHEAFDSYPADYTPLALAPSVDSAGNPQFPAIYCASDVETGAQACGSPYIMVAGAGVVIRSQVSLTPTAQTLATGTSASLAATVTSASGAPVTAGSVAFSVDSGPDTAATATKSLDASGSAQFSYDNSGTPGTDSVSATYTDPATGISQKAIAAVTWSTSPTTLTTGLDTGDGTSTSVSFPVGDPVTDTATLAGANAAKATGTVTYNVYSDAACTQLESAGTPQPITTPGQLPDSQPVSVTWPGTYYWQAVYSGDDANGPSRSDCGPNGEVEHAFAGEGFSSVSTALSGGGQSGTAITVPAGTAVTDAATVDTGSASGSPAPGPAGGAVRYNVYSDAACTVLAQAGPSRPIITPGVVPPSAPVTLSTPGTYYWQAQYSGDQFTASSSSPCGRDGGEVETVQVPPTALTTSLSGGGKSGTSVTVPAGTAVTDHATLSGANAHTATGSVTYTVYSDAACSVAVSAGSPLPLADGGVPDSAPVALSTPGTYYWQVAYPGDSLNGASLSTCGPDGEVETVIPVPLPTTITTSLSGGGKTGAKISVTAGTPVTDSARLAGANAAHATGTVTYTVFSDAACTKLAKSAGPVTIGEGGLVPASPAVTLTAAGTYYWKASYSGDSGNQASSSTCGASGEAETVTPLPPATSVTTSLTGAGHSGPKIAVPFGQPARDVATLAGANAAKATGTMTFRVYSDSKCTRLVASAATTVISKGTSTSAAEVLAAGTYYWTTSYSGDSANRASASPCGSEVLSVRAAAGKPGAAPAIDTVTVTAAKTTAAATVRTTVAGDLVVAFVAGRGPASSRQASTVSGGGLTWYLISRQNAPGNDSEVWAALPSGKLSGTVITARASIGGFDEVLVVVTFKNAHGIGPSVFAHATSGAPRSSLKTAVGNSWVFGLGSDWRRFASRVPGPGQLVFAQVATPSKATAWLQAPVSVTAKAGTTVTLNDTAPASDPWNLLLVAIE